MTVLPRLKVRLPNPSHQNKWHSVCVLHINTQHMHVGGGGVCLNSPHAPNWRKNTGVSEVRVHVQPDIYVGPRLSTDFSHCCRDVCGPHAAK